MFERYTEQARRVIFFARYEANQFGSPYVEPEHLLLALLREEEALRKLVCSEAVRKAIEARTSRQDKTSTSISLPLNHELKRILAYGAEESERLGHREINCLHLALGVLREEKSLAAQLLAEQGVQRETIVAQLAAPTESLPAAAS